MNLVIFSEGNTSTFESSVKDAMQAPIKHFEKELAGIRTGRASTLLVSDLKVETYGQVMKLKELATVSTPEARLLVIQPWDRTTIEAIEKAIETSDLGVNPVNDGQVIRLQFPMLSSERREELVKILGKKTEECRVGIRNIRKEYHNQLRDAEKKKLISEDFAKRLNDLLQKITDNFIAQADGLQNKKEAELKTV